MNATGVDPERLKEMLGRVIAGTSLDHVEARDVMAGVLEGAATPAQIGALLVALRQKGETVEEIVGFVEAMRAACVPVKPRRRDLVDLCGTGGDGSGTINISTAAALIVAATGVGVAKHGNRAASSRCGSADVLETLGVPIDLEPERSAACLDEVGFVFLFAPRHHPAMRHAAGPRRELGVRTVFNILGPLCNPVGVRRQLIGVFDGAVSTTMAAVLGELGSEHVWVVHAPCEGGGGLDELSIGGSSSVVELRRASSGACELREFEITPETCGLARAPDDALRGGDARHNAERIVAILRGESGPQRDAVLLNAGAALLVAGRADDLRAGVELAAKTVDSGAATDFLERLRVWR